MHGLGDHARTALTIALRPEGGVELDEDLPRAPKPDLLDGLDLRGGQRGLE